MIAMKRLLFVCFTFLLAVQAFPQYKNDNVAFKTLDWTELCNTLKNNKGYLLLDVRSKGEFSDTSSFAQLNIGHLKDAVNISVQELSKRLSEINADKNRPVFIYCSHSQRSRRAGKMLADSGFTHLYNINGGMTALYYSNAKTNPCLKELLVSQNSYDVLSATEVVQKLDKGPGKIFILDVRSDSAFKHISTDAKVNAFGSLKGTVNIPFESISDKLSAIPHDKEIIVTDIYGREASKTATLLRSKGYEHVSVLLEGLERWQAEENPNAANKSKWYQPAVSYKLLNTLGFNEWIQSHPDGLILDVRTTDAFGNTHKDAFRNIGHVKNARNIPAAEIDAQIAGLAAYKNKPVVIYSFSGDPDSHKVAQALVKDGFTDVQVLITGLFDIRWTAHNIKGMMFLQDLVTDVPEINR